MIVELQIDVDAFCRAFREQMRKALACRLSEDVLDIDESDNVAGTPYIVTGYTVDLPKIRRARQPSSVCIHTGAANVTTIRQVIKPELVVNVVAHVSWRHEIDAANTAKAPDIPLNLPLVFELGMDTCANMRLFCLTYKGLDGVDAPFASKLAQSIGTRCINLPIDSVIAAYLPSGVNVINSHLTLAQGDKALVIRMEFWSEAWGAANGDPARSLPDWDQFYSGHIADHLQRGNQRDGWSIFLEHKALTSFVRRTIADSLSGASGLSIVRQPVATWSETASLLFPTPANHIHANLEVQKKNACWCFTEDIDVNADVDADVYISVPTEDTLRIDVWVDVDPDFWDATCCVLTAFLFWPILGLGQAIKGKIKDWEYYLGLLPFVSLIGAIIEMNKAGSDFPPPGGFTKDKDNDEHAFREQKLNLPNDPAFGKMTLRGAEPKNDPSSLKATGLYLYGGLETWSPPQPVLQDPQLDPFTWGKTARCSRRVAVHTNFRLYPENPQHWALLQVCDARIIDDPLGVFKLRVEQPLHGMIDLFIEADYWAMGSKNYWSPQYRYPCRLIVKTTGGVRILTFPPLAQLTDQQFEDLAHEIQLQYVNNCYYPRHRLFEELEWPIEVLIEQPGLINVQVRVAGLEPQEQLRLIEQRGEQKVQIAKFNANRNGTLLVNALGRLQEGGGPPLTLQRASSRTAILPPTVPQTLMSTTSGAPDSETSGTGEHEGHGESKDHEEDPNRPSGSSTSALTTHHSPLTTHDSQLATHDSESRGVVIRQTNLVEAGRIVAAGECVFLAGDRSEGVPRILVGSAGLVEAYDVSDPDAPRLMESWRAEGVRGAVTFSGELIFWGVEGIWVAADGPPARQSARFARCELNGVRGAAVVGDRLVVLREDGLRAYDSRLCEAGTRDDQDWTCRSTYTSCCEPDDDSNNLEQIAAAGGFVAARYRDGVRLLDGLLREAAFHSMRGVRHIESPAVRFGGDVLYARGQEGGVVLQVHADGSLGRIAEYEGGAWFEGVARAGCVLALLTADRRTVRLIAAGLTALSE